MKVRDDLTLAAYAVALGYAIQCKGAAIVPDHFVRGIPHNDLQFELGSVTVWDTARGWRVGRLIDGVFERPSADQFHNGLLAALEAGHQLAKKIGDAK